MPLQGKEGLWQPYPVEYKRGKPKEGTEDALQLCCQACSLKELCLPSLMKSRPVADYLRRAMEVDE